MCKSTAAGITETAAAAGGCQRVIVRLPADGTAACNGASVQYCLLFFPDLWTLLIKLSKGVL